MTVKNQMDWKSIAWAVNWKTWPTVEAILKKESDPRLIAKLIVFYGDILASIGKEIAD